MMLSAAVPTSSNCCSMSDGDHDSTLDKQEAQYQQWLQQYKVNLGEMETILTSTTNTAEYSFVYHFYQTGDSDLSHVHTLFAKIIEKETDCDLHIAELIRCLYVDFEEFKSYRLGVDALDSDDAVGKDASNMSRTARNYSRVERSSIQLLEIESFKQEILNVLQQFIFWPEESNNMKGKTKGISPKGKTNAPKSKDMNNLVFWTESHIFLMLGSAVLYYQYIIDILPIIHANDDITKYDIQSLKAQYDKMKALLRHYFRMHFPTTPGSGSSDPYIFEPNSMIHNSYCMCALLNLFDFSLDDEIKHMSEQLIDQIVYQMLLCTDPSTGIANLTATCRHSNPLYKSNRNHEGNQLIKALNNGISIDCFQPSYMTCYLLTTTWLPKANAYHILHNCGQVCYQKLLTPPFLSTENIALDHIPFYWSLGMMTCSSMIEYSKLYVEKYNLIHNKDLWPLHIFTPEIITFMKDLNHTNYFTIGQQLCNIKLTLYKLPKVTLSSYSMYNCHYIGYQQIPWCANINGIPIYSRTGYGISRKSMLLRRGIENSHMPAVQQYESILLATYVTPPYSLIRSSFDTSIQLLWPLCRHMHIHRYTWENYKRLPQPIELKDWKTIISKHDKKIKQYVWIIGQHDDVYIGCLFTQFPNWENGSVNDAVDQTNGQYYYNNLVTVKPSIDEPVSLIVVVGTSMEYDNLAEFVEERLNHVKINESIEIDNSIHNATSTSHRRKIYKIIVEDNQTLKTLKYSCDIHNPYEMYHDQTQDTKDENVMISRNITSTDQIVEVVRYSETNFPFNSTELLRESRLIELPYEWLMLNETLGKGGFGVTMKATLKTYGWEEQGPIVVAVKFMIERTPISNEESSLPNTTTMGHRRGDDNVDHTLNAFVNEMALVKRFVDIPYIVQCYGYVDHPNYGHGLVLELAPYGSLYNVIQLPCYREYVLNDLENCKRWIFAWLKDISGALVYLHRLDIIHQDLKPSNILVFPGLKIKLSDFGISHQFSSNNSSKSMAAGTFLYRAPELRALGTGKAVLASDIFSWAMTAIALFKGSNPQDGYQDDIDRFVSHKNPDIQNRIVNIIRNCAKYDLNPNIENYGRPQARTLYAELDQLERNGAHFDSTDHSIFECILQSVQ